MFTETDADDCLASLFKSSRITPTVFSEEMLGCLARTARSIFLSQPMLLELDAPINICGDIHGQYIVLINMFEQNGIPGEKKCASTNDYVTSNYLFLGDYVDRGNQSIDVLAMMLCFKIKYPESFFMLRGNHECASLNRIYGFYDECKRKYSVKLWKIFSDCFNCLPVAAVVGDKIFCCHGGISPDLIKLGDIHRIVRPTEIADDGLMADLLWSDPAEHNGWEENTRYVYVYVYNNTKLLLCINYLLLTLYRGVSYSFGQDVTEEFLIYNQLDLICRGHQVVEDGRWLCVYMYIFVYIYILYVYIRPMIF